MYKANQIIGDEYYNLKKTDKFNSLDYGVNLVYGLNGQFSKNIGLFFEMRNTFGLAQIENKLEENKQDLYNRVFSVHLGIKFILNKDSEKKTKPVNEDML